jgi:colicin import membrane protein
MRLLRERPRPFVYAVLVHAVLLAVLMFSLDWAPSVKPTTASKQAPVQAVVVDAARLDAEVARQKQAEDAKQREAREKLERLEAQARAAEQKRRQEEERAAEVKRQREAQVLQQAEEKRKAEEVARQQAEAEKQRQAETAERQRQAEAKQKAAAEKQRQAEAERQRQEEAKQKAEAEKQRQEEARQKAEAEKQRQEEAKRKAEAERQRQEAEARKAAEQEMRARLAAEQDRLTAQRQSAMQRMINEYVGYIQEKVQRSWIRPPSSGVDLSCTVEVRLIPGGEVIDAQIVRSSGNTGFDRSVVAAVYKASPLPVPPDPEVMNQFRSLRFEFKPGSV